MKTPSKEVIMLCISAELKALISLLEKKGIVTQKEVDELEIELIKEKIVLEGQNQLKKNKGGKKW